MRFTDRFFEGIIRRYASAAPGASPQETRARIGFLEAWVSIVSNLLLAGFKVAFGLYLNSISLLADAVHTASDVITSVVVLLGFRAARAPADAEHPYGHGRVESIATLIIAMLLVVVGFEFAGSSISRFVGGEAVRGNLAVAAILVLSGVFKEVLARFSEYLGHKIDSSTLIADGWHHRTDAIASVLVAIALVASRLGYPKVDAVLGLAVAMLIVYTGWELGRKSGSELIGQGAAPVVLSQITETVAAIDGVEGVHGIRLHNYGAGQSLVSLHIEVRQDLHVGESHAIAERVEATLADRMGIEATVHVEPLITDVSD